MEGERKGFYLIVVLMLRHKTRQWLWSLMLWLLGNNLLSVLLLTVTQSAASRGRGATGPVSAPGSARPQYNLGSAAHSYLHYPHYIYTLLSTLFSLSIHSYLHYPHYLYTHIYTILTIYTLYTPSHTSSVMRQSIPCLAECMRTTLHSSEQKYRDKYELEKYMPILW